MRDITPSKMCLRDYCLNLITNQAQQAGYEKIETPAIEHIENLSSRQGGDNESLIFKILKRGEALSQAENQGQSLVDSGLRYDLTLPLARFFANNQKDLNLPFKALQIGPVWRADRPQKGRFRQFIQCDMDLIGDASILAEIDIITTVGTILKQLLEPARIKQIKIRLNDRRILMGLTEKLGLKTNQQSQALISLDKLDKIGFAGVEQDLLNHGFDQTSTKRFLSYFKDYQAERPSQFWEQITLSSDCPNFINDLEAIMTQSQFLSGLQVEFDPSLVRGMGYYTGPIFECSVEGFTSSVAGGGRYDQMIGKISGGQDIAACGFSIGFERIITLLEERGFKPPKAPIKRAILIDKKAKPEQVKAAFIAAQKQRQAGEIVSVMIMNKNLKHQIDNLSRAGFSHFDKIYPKK